MEMAPRTEMHDGLHYTDKPSKDSAVWNCEIAGRGTRITDAAIEDLNYCPFCGRQISKALPAYLRGISRDAVEVTDE